MLSAEQVPAEFCCKVPGQLGLQVAQSRLQIGLDAVGLHEGQQH